MGKMDLNRGKIQYFWKFHWGSEWCAIFACALEELR
jgi:hypothetical protein